MAAKVASHPFHDGFPTSTAAQDRSQNKHNNVDVEEKHNESNTYNEMEIDGEKNERIEAAERQKLKKNTTNRIRIMKWKSTERKMKESKQLKGRN
mmetsp:Transcript_27338/g.33384  ORF Transcript_27338/g.33384 Transcript_27338/m.33384 type:complete len:95 (-) Transcript_27338:55-339(-)